MAHEWNAHNSTAIADPMALGELQSPKDNIEVQNDDQFNQESKHTSGVYQEIAHTDLKAVGETALDSNPLGMDFLKGQDDNSLTPTKSPLLGDTVPEFDIDTGLHTPKHDPPIPALLDRYSDVSSCSEPDNDGTEQTAESHETLSTKNLSRLDGPLDKDNPSTLKTDICESAALSCEMNNQSEAQEENFLEDQYSNISSPEPEIERETSDLTDEGQELKQDVHAAPESVSDHTQKSGDGPLTVDDVKEMIKQINTSPVSFQDVNGNVGTLTDGSSPKPIDGIPEAMSVAPLGPQENPTSQSKQTENLESGFDNRFRNKEGASQFDSCLELEHSSFEFLETCLKNSEDGLKSGFETLGNSQPADISACVDPKQTQPQPNSPKQAVAQNEQKEMDTVVDSLMLDPCIESQDVFETQKDKIELSDNVTEQDNTLKRGESSFSLDEGSHLLEVPCLIESHNLKKKLDPVVVVDYKERNNSQIGIYRCSQCSVNAECVDLLIEHHHQHFQHHFQFCQTCGCYLTSSQLAERHRCGKHEPERPWLFPETVQCSKDSKKPTKAKTLYKCSYCPLMFSKKESFRIHELRHKTKTPFKCHRCSLYFSQSSSLKRHQRLNRCAFLKTTSEREEKSHTVKKMMKPPINTSLGTFRECFVKLVDISSRDPVSPSNTCKICNKIFRLRAQYNSHMKTHTSEKPYKCKDCCKAFKYSWNLNRHRREQCDRIPKICKEEHSQCSVSNEQDREMEDTEQEASTPFLGRMYTNYKCPLCPRAFKYSYNLFRHLRVQCLKEYTKIGGKAKTSSGYKCPLCNVVFTLIGNLSRHIKNTCFPLYKANKVPKVTQVIKSEVTEGKSKPKVSVKKLPYSGMCYKCKLCPAIFRHTSGLHKHSMKHRLSAKTGKPVRYRTADPNFLRATAPSDPKREEKLACRFCGQRFTETLSLKKHMSQHGGDKPFVCQKCGKCFKKHAYLIAHAQSHKRKVQCSVCNKIFPTIADLLQHRESHDNKGMLKCPDCQMEFRFPVYLLRHLVTHERKDKLRANQAKKVALQPVEEPAKKLKSPMVDKEEFGCSLCQKYFPDSKALSDHCVSHLPKASSSKCQFCKRSFSSRAALIRHIRLHTGEKPFPCKKCGKYFQRVETMKAHLEICGGMKVVTQANDAKATVKTEKLKVKQVLHKAKKQFKCPHCPHSFVWLSSLTKHLNGHQSKLLSPCSKCARCYRKTILDSHEKECNGKDSNTVVLFPCKKCGKSFSRMDNKNVHERKCKGTPLTNVKKISQEIGTALKDKLPHRCPHCSKSFKYRSYLLKHLPSHLAEKPYTCMHCGHKYADQRRYLQHEAFCDGVFRRKSVPLQEVVKTEPVNDTSQDGINSAESDGQYRCKFCNKNFAKARNLRRHILTHTDVKPYRCKTCDSCFSRYDHLKVHQNRCRGKKQRLEVRLPKINLKQAGNSVQAEQEDVFQCKTCSKQFTSQINLARHTSLLHTTLKPFACKRCGTSFSSASSLKKHTLLVKCKRASLSTSTKTVNTKVSDQQCRETAKLLQRIQGHYSSKLKFHCAYCPRRFKNRTQAQVHTRLHTGEKPFGCENCGERFIRRDYLQRHLVKCTSKREVVEKTLCDGCGQLFPQETLSSHKSNCVVSSKEIKKEKRMTSSPPPKVRAFSCTNCTEKFLLFSQLQQHFLSMHREDTLQKSCVLSEDAFLKKGPLGEKWETRSAQTDEVHKPSDDDKPHSCPYCGMRFVNSSGLGMHVRTHTAEYPLTCQKCNKGFWSRNVQKKHLRRCPGKMNTNSPSPAMASESFSKEESAVLVFDKGSSTTGTGVLQTQFSCKDGNKKLLREAEHGSGEDHLPDKAKKTANKYQCSECDKSFTDGLLLISHLENHGREDLLKPRCKICGKEFDKQGTLSRHMSAHHGLKSPKINICQICSKSFRFPSDLEAHKSCHDPNRPFSCSTCDLRFWSQKSLNLHATVSHPKLESFTCHPCNKTYSTRKSYARHKREKHCKGFAAGSDPDKGNDSSTDQFDIKVGLNEESDVSVKDENEASEDDSDSAPYFPCHVCGKTFSTSESLEDHQRCHLGEKPHECEECGKCFFQLVNLQQHQRSHKSEFQCQTCGRGFVSLFALRKHKHSHGKSRPHRCTKCHLSFTGPSQLAEHMATHRDENFPCDLCDRTFSCKITRAEHRKTHTEQEEELPPLIPPSSASPSMLPPLASSSSPKSGEQAGSFKYRCGVCSMRFKDPEQLSEHGCKAAKERPYACPECDKHFLHGSHLKKHQLSHQLAGPYRYQCNQCHMNFTYRHHFLSHIRRHGNDRDSIDVSGDRDGVPAKNSDSDNIYQCPICPQSYSQAMELADHLTVHSFICKVCNMTFPSKAELESHEQCHLTATTQYECTECGESFLGSDAFRQHQCAQRKRSYAETRTGSQLSPSTSLKNSSRSSGGVEEEEEVDVGEDFYNCKVCKKRFSSQADLGEHHKMNIECRPYKCQICGKRFARRRYLSKHQLIHERPFRCDVCPQSFDSESSLLAHQGIHNVDRDFQCSVCHKRYTTANDLLRHEKKHSELQDKKTGGAHRCDMCYKSFGHLSLLRKHQETHVGEVVYECTECDKAFAFFHLLEEHQRTHIPDLTSVSSSLHNPDIDQV